MTRSVRVGEFASTELAEAIQWYETRRARLGAELLDAVSGALALLERNPEIGSRAGSGGSGTRRILVKKFPYHIVYRLTPTEIVIVAVAHLKRRPDYWKDRERGT